MSSDSCAYCHKRDVPLQACSGCKSVYYCGKSCQKKHWKERNGHKEDCELYAKDRKEWKLIQKAKKVGELDIQDRFEWKIHVKSKDSKQYLVLDIDDDEVIGEKELKLPETKEEICKAIFSFILNPKESWRRAKRPLHNIYIAADSLEFFEPYYKYLWAEFLYVPMTLWREGYRSDMSYKFNISIHPRMKWGTHAEGEVYYDPILKLRIAYLSKEERREYFEQRVKWMSDSSTEELVEMIGFCNDVITKKPRFEWMEYESLEELLEEYDELGEWDEEERLHYTKEVYQYEAEYELGEEPRSEEEVCMDEFNAKSVQECIWDYSGVPRLVCDGSESAKNSLERAGFECQGYKPGRYFCLSESSVQLGSRLISAGGIFYEEGASRGLNSVKVWVKNAIDREVANEKIVESFEEQYVKQNIKVDPAAEPVNILVLDGGGMKGYGGMQMLSSLQELYCKEKGCDLFDQFDFIAGTSIRGVTALGAADLNANGWSTDAMLSLKGRDMIDEAGEKSFKSISLKNILFSNQLVRKDSQVIDVLQPDFDKPLRQDYCIPTMECDQPKPLASSSSAMKLYEALAATSVVPLILDSVKVDVEGRKRIMGNGGIFQNCPMALALDEVHRLYPTQPLGVILNIGYDPDEENLIHRTIETARLVHPNLHYQRIAPHQIFNDFFPAETDRKVISDMEAKVEQYIKTIPRVKNALRVTMKKLLRSKPRCFGKRYCQKSVNRNLSLKQNNLDSKQQLRKHFSGCSLLGTLENSYFGDDLSLTNSSVSSSEHDELISLESFAGEEKQKETPKAQYDLSKEVVYDLSKEVTFEVKNKRKKNFLQKFKMCQSL